MLYVCATPIGNLGDVTPRVLDTLRAVELVAAEDTRHKRKLLSHFDIHVPLTSLFQHNEAQKTEGVLRLVMLEEAGQRHVDVEVAQELARVTRVLGGDELDRAERVEDARRHARVADDGEPEREMVACL